MAIDIQKFMNVEFPTRLAQNPDAARAIGGKFQLNITGNGGGEWFIDVSNSGPFIQPGVDAADVNISIRTEDFMKLMENPKTNYAQLLFAGKLKTTGNQSLSMKLPQLLNIGQS